MKKVSCFVSANIHKSLIRPAIAVSLLVLTVIAAVPAEDHPVTRTLRPLSYNIHHAEGTDRKLDLARIAGTITAAAD